MLCERCKHAEATIHLTEIIKDVKSEVHLCEGCARDIGLNSKLSSFSLSIPEMLSFLDVNEVDDAASGVACRTCGFSYYDYSRENKLGCPDCYRHMEGSLRQVIAGYHGAMHHAGKHPAHAKEDPRHTPHCIESVGASHMRATACVRDAPCPGLDELKTMLEDAVDEERYEEAAILRDRIRQWKND